MCDANRLKFLAVLAYRDGKLDEAFDLFTRARA